MDARKSKSDPVVKCLKLKGLGFDSSYYINVEVAVAVSVGHIGEKKSFNSIL